MAHSPEFDNAYWQTILDADTQDASESDRLHMLGSLLVFLNIPIHRLLMFLFTCNAQPIRIRAGLFMGYHASSEQPEDRFRPLGLFKLWRDHWPKSKVHLDQLIIQPHAEDIVLAESDRIIEDKELQIKLGALTVDGVRALLQPGRIAARLRELAPFTFDLLHEFAAAPNTYRLRQQREAASAAAAGPDGTGVGGGTDEDGWESEGEWEESDLADEEAADGDPRFSTQWRKEYPGFLRNPCFAVTVAITMLGFVRNRATNVLALPLGLFLGISGTSSRVLSLLSNIGLSVSITTIERLKEQISRDASEHAIELLKGDTMFCIILDNIDIYLRKFQERITNRNAMIHATNVAVIAIGGPRLGPTDAQAKLDLRGNRMKATFSDIRPTTEDSEHMNAAFEGLVAEMLVRYFPGSNKWKGRRTMLQAIEGTIPKDRPLPVEVTDTRPLGVIDVNSGSKKGVIAALKEIQEKSMVPQEEWSSDPRIIQGDWLTASNMRAARRERVDDVNAMERLEYVEEISALWHFALNATHMLMRVHFGNAITDHTSLAKHKGLLQRTWDAKKPNYAAAHQENPTFGITTNDVLLLRKMSNCGHSLVRCSSALFAMVRRSTYE
ncbi:uncharacterized protein B0H18DRAFT_1191221 [Fomitopsis serialis]|uniref:uncharacterized protein n=1 Tax=Fomitopsis serialis TaxID=139415 RepID=UPI002008E461|nr:uncharacterized protein B0H18DRAFT_1191221 [Neoantrodia serialis]KAH9920682.1 hypothetical protein B0H18DRAFT_1191221 [Neoantrodia serialis]